MKRLQFALITTTFVLCAQLAAASSILINGTCRVGSCSSSDTLALGSSSATPFDLLYTFANTDSYQLQGTLYAANQSDGFQIAIQNFDVTYLGNSSGTGSARDVLVNDFTQPITLTGGRTSAYENISGVFGPGLGDASSASGQFFVGSSGLQVLGPYTSPQAFAGSSTGTLNFASNPTLDYRYSLTFGSGTLPGSSISVNPTAPSPAPEPSSIVLVGTGVLGMAAVLRRRYIPTASGISN